MMMKQTLVVMGIVVLAVLSGCSRSNNAHVASTSDTTTNQQDDSKTDIEDRKETGSTEVKPGKASGKPNSKDRLLEKADFIFDGVPLEEFAKTVSERFEIIVWINDNALDEVGHDRKSPITVNLKEVSLRTGLSIALRGLGLAWDYDSRESYVVISTAEQLEMDLSTRVYRLNEKVNREALSNNILAAIEPDTWEEVGGTGVLTATIGNSLVISQTDEIHRKIGKTFGAFLHPVEPGVSNVPKEEWAALMAALSAKTNLDVVDIRLTDLLGQLSDEHQLRIVIDEQSLDEVGLDSSSITVTANVKQLSWGTALKLILAQNYLTYAMDSDGELLTITTNEGAEVAGVPILYKIDDLVSNNLDYDMLVETITSNIEPSYWEEVGGFGVIAILPNQGVISIVQATPVHFKIAQLMADLRQLKE